MKNMKFNVAALIEKIDANRKAHRAIFLEALEGYKAKVLEALEKNLEAVKQGNVVRVYINLPPPDDHTKDYDRVLLMLDMCTEQEVELNEQEFGCYVMDDWGWKHQFLTANSVYSNTAAGALQNSE